MIEQDVDGCEMIYCLMKAPFPVSNRDFLQVGSRAAGSRAFRVSDVTVLSGVGLRPHVQTEHKEPVFCCAFFQVEKNGGRRRGKRHEDADEVKTAPKARTQSE